MNLDDELRYALRRQDPQEGFAERVMARALASPRERRPHPMAPVLLRRWLFPAVACALVVLVFSASTYQRRRQGERASRQAILALRIASKKLNFTRQKVLTLNHAWSGTAERRGTASGVNVED